MPYVKNSDPHLNIYCPKIITAYIESRLLYARAVVRYAVKQNFCCAYELYSFLNRSFSLYMSLDTKLRSEVFFYRGEVSDDPLEDQGAVQQIMEQIAIICRCEYEKSAELVTRLFDREYAIYECITPNSSVSFKNVAKQ